MFTLQRDKRLINIFKIKIAIYKLFENINKVKIILHIYNNKIIYKNIKWN